MYFPANGWNQSLWIGVRSYGDETVAHGIGPGVLREGNVNRRVHLRFQTGKPCVRDDANHLPPTPRFRPNLKMFADGVLTRPVTVRQFIIDDNRIGRIVFVTIGEFAPFDETYAHGTKVAWTDRAVVRDRLLPRVNRLPLHGEDHRGESCDRDSERAPSSLYARQSLKLGQCALIKLQVLPLVPVGLR